MRSSTIGFAASALFALVALFVYISIDQELVRGDQFLASVHSAVSDATTYYVAPNGSNGNSGETPQSALKSIQMALGKAQPGDTIVLASGAYYEDLETVRNGSASAPITLMGPSDAVIHGGGNGRIFQIFHDYHTLDGFTIDGRHSDSDSKNSYRDKLVYVQGKETRSGVTGLRMLNMDLKNAGGECVRFRYFAENNEVAYSTFTNCGVHDYVYNDGGKNGEGVYIGTAPEQRGDGKNPTTDPDESNGNWIHHNVFNTRGNECVDIKESASDNIIEYNSCTGQRDPNSAGLDSRGSGNIFRFNISTGNLGAGVRVGGDDETDGRHNYIYGNSITNNKKGGIKVMRYPQAAVCGNTMRDNDGGNTVGNYGSDIGDPTAPCSDDLPPPSGDTPPPPPPPPPPLPEDDEDEEEETPPTEDDSGDGDEDEDEDEEGEYDTPSEPEPEPVPPTPDPDPLPLAFEAEAGIVTSPMKVVNNSSASGGYYVVQTDKKGRGDVTYAVHIEKEGTYTLRARVIASRGSQNSIYYAFDGDNKTTLHFPDNITSWKWVDGPEVNLTEGTHVFTIWKRERNTKIDAFELKYERGEDKDEDEEEDDDEDEDDDSSDSRTVSSREIFEAEWGTIESPMEIKNNSSASGGSYVVQDSERGDGTITFSIAVAKSDTYELRARVISPAGDENSVYYAFDGESRDDWHFSDDNSSWTWEDGPEVYLRKGTHTLVISKREENTKLDAFQLVPQGTSTEDSDDTYDYNNPPEPDNDPPEPPDYDSD